MKTMGYDVKSIDRMQHGPCESVTITIPNSAFAMLTSREAQVARLLCCGRRNSEIAEELQISIKTVDTHRGHSLKKVNEPNNVRLLIRALRDGFVTIDDVDPRGAAS
jgi:DNA-binding NarL/FixJ family response regulator